MKLVEVNVDGTKFKVQDGFSYIQQNELMNIIEDFIDLPKMNKIKGEGEITLDQVNDILKEGKKVFQFNFELSKYCLLTFVKEPPITEENLNDPDNPDADNYQVLGLKLSELALAHITKKALLKKTPTE